MFCEHRLYLYGVKMSDYEYRPQSFSSIVGNELNNKLLLAIAKSGGPSVLIMSGSYGCGKTTYIRCQL